MDNEKRKRLEAAGWKSGTIAEFLGLSEKDAVVVELRLALSKALKQKRLESKMTQEVFAKKLHTNQSRIAKIESGDPTVSFDLMINKLLAVGVDRKTLAAIIGG